MPSYAITPALLSEDYYYNYILIYLKSMEGKKLLDLGLENGSVSKALALQTQWPEFEFQDPNRGAGWVGVGL